MTSRVSSTIGDIQVQLVASYLEFSADYAAAPVVSRVGIRKAMVPVSARAGQTARRCINSLEGRVATRCSALGGTDHLVVAGREANLLVALSLFI
jgi:hypothetical protein